jgi:hypothetical protein
MTKDLLKLWMPIEKGANGRLTGILSDNSLDRDFEFMTKGLLEDWARGSKPLPMLANHENKMEKFIGGWTNKRLVSKGKRHALVAEPFFFSKEANPLAAQIEKQVQEALEKGMGIGISIGALPLEMVEKEVNGVMRRGFSKAEIVEATVVPIQSNRNASFSAIAKSFDLGEEQSEVIDVQTKEQNMECTKMVEEIKKEVVSEEVVEKQVEAVEKVVETKVVAKDFSAEIIEMKKSIEDFKLEKEALVKELNDLKTKAVLKGTVEGPVVQKKFEDAPITMESMIKSYMTGVEE